MNDEGDGAGERGKIFSSMTAWLGGITGLVVAITGLLAVWPQGKKAEPAEAMESAAEIPAVEEPAADEPVEDSTAAPLPLKYAAVGATFEKVDGEWVYTSDSEETHYQEVSRRGGNTVVYDPQREVYARWPNRGGNVEEKGSAEGAEWAHSFDIWVPKPAEADQ